MHNTLTSPSLLNSSKTEKHDNMHLWLSEQSNQMSIISLLKNLPEIEDWPERWTIEGRKCEDKRKMIKTRLADAKLQILLVKREVPVYSQNYKSRYLQGICDAIITFRINATYEEKSIELIHVRDHIIKSTNIEKFDFVEEGYFTNEKCRYVKADKGKTRFYEQPYDELCGMCKVYEDKVGYVNRLEGTCRVLIEFKPTLNSISGIIGQIKVYRDCIGDSHLVIITYDKNEKYDSILKAEGITIIRIEESKEETKDE